jgi:GDP-D-mannose dehydratase
MFPKKENHHYKFIDNRNTGTDSSIADISVAKERIGFKAERKLEDYIRSMI